MLRLLQPLPRLVYVRDHLPLLGRVRFLIVRAHLRLQGEQQHLEVPLLDELGRFLHGSVVGELGKLRLDTHQRIGKSAVAQRLYSTLDPTQQIAGQALVLVYHAIVLHCNADHFAYPFTLHRLLFHLGEVMVIRDHVSDDRFLVRMVHENILRVQKFRQTEFVLGHVERVVQVVYGVRFGQFLELDQIWPVFVNDGVERNPSRQEVVKFLTFTLW